MNPFAVIKTKFSVTACSHNPAAHPIIISHDQLYTGTYFLTVTNSPKLLT